MGVDSTPGIQSASDEVFPAKATVIPVFVPIGDWSIGRWVVITLVVGLGAVTLAAIGYVILIAMMTHRWSLALVLLAIGPWWLLFGRGTRYWVKSVARGGFVFTIGVNPYGILAAGDEEGTAWRCFSYPKLTETPDELVIENSDFWMVARLPIRQLTAVQVELIRRSVRHMNPSREGGVPSV
jgi:hypothetical protein